MATQRNVSRSAVTRLLDCSADPKSQGTTHHLKLCLFRSRFSVLCSAATMDAVTLVAAALAVAVEQSRQSALQALLLDRERAAMRAADAETKLAHRVDQEVAQLRGVWRAARHHAARIARERAAARQRQMAEPESADTRARSRSPR